MQGNNTPRLAGLASVFPQTLKHLTLRLTNKKPLPAAPEGTP